MVLLATILPGITVVAFLDTVVLLYFRKVHKYGKSTTGESWDLVVDEETYYE
jgi:hypothetical protein